MMHYYNARKLEIVGFYLRLLLSISLLVLSYWAPRQTKWHLSILAAMFSYEVTLSLIVWPFVGLWLLHKWLRDEDASR